MTGRKAEIVGDVLAFFARLISGASLRVTNADALGESQRVYVANHSSHLDFIVLWAALPASLRRITRPVAAKDYWNKSAFRRYLAIEVYRAILIERENISSSNNPIELISEEMGDRFSVILFPEGTRGKGDEVGTFKSGIYHLAKKKPGLTCVPVYLENLNRVLPKGEILPLPILSSITIGAPLQLDEEEKKTEFLAKLREAVMSLKTS